MNTEPTPAGDAISREPGDTVWHSSDGESGPDVGISVFLANGDCLYAGELPHEASITWGIALYPADGDRIDIAHRADPEASRDMIDAISQAIRSLPPAQQDGESFQARVNPWMQACFGPVISADRLERGDRLLEEVLELLQSGDYPRERIAALTGYVWDRPAGEPAQEVGGVMVTLAAYCLAHGLHMHQSAETELARIWTKVEKIRAKQAAKPTGSALPQAWPAALTAQPVAQEVWPSGAHRHWRVTVETGADQIVCIETECMSGRELSAADEATIRQAARHLLSFIGDPAQPVAQEPVADVPDRTFVTWPNAGGTGLAFNCAAKTRTEYIRADLAHPATPAPVEADTGALAGRLAAMTPVDALCTPSRVCADCHAAAAALRAQSTAVGGEVKG